MLYFVHEYEVIIGVTCHPLSHSLKTFFNKARDMLYFKRLIQIPKLPDVRAQRVGERWDDFSAESQPPSWMSSPKTLYCYCQLHT